MAAKRQQQAFAEKNALKREIANLKGRMKIYEQQNRTLSEDLKTAQSEVRAPAADVEELKEIQAENSRLRIEKTRLQESNQKLHNKIETILERQQQLQQVSFNSERSMRSLAEKEKRISTLQTRIDLLVLENERLMGETVEKENLLEDNQKLTTEKNTLMSECAKLQRDLEQANLDKNEAMKELKVKESKVEELTKQLNDTQVRAIKALHAKNFEKEKEEFRQTKQELEDKIRELEDDAKQSRRDAKQKDMKMEDGEKTTTMKL
eukprot:UN25905